MGVINLGLLVDKIKRKLESSGFIKNTDYASASTAGVVKVGTGLAISDAGVLSTTGGAGFTRDVLFEEGAEPVALAENATVTLAHNYSDYKLICVALRRSTDVATNGYTLCMYDASFTDKQFQPFTPMSGSNATCGVIFNPETPTTLKIAGVVSNTNIFIGKVFGYK